MTLFDLDFEAATEIYRRMQAEGREEDRARFDALFERAKPYLDSNFKDQFARSTNERFFELRLTITLLDHGFELDAAQEVRIPVIVGTHSTRWWAPIPRDRGRRIRPTSAWSQALV